MKTALIASICHTLHAAYCRSLGDDSQPSWDDAPEAHKQRVIAEVEVQLAHPAPTPEQAHEAWRVRKAAEGWSYGETEDEKNKRHPWLVPYAQLAAEKKSQDFLFHAAVHALKNIADASHAVAGIASADLANRIGVRYIGRRAQWSDRIYNSGLSFTTAQVRAVPGAIAHKLLRHADLFEEVALQMPDASTAVSTVVSTALSTAVGATSSDVVIEDDTDASIEAARKQHADEVEAQMKTQHMRDQINQMTKQSLIDYAAHHYQQNLNKRDSLEVLRAQVHHFENQFGPV